MRSLTSQDCDGEDREARPRGGCDSGSGLVAGHHASLKLWWRAYAELWLRPNPTLWDTGELQLLLTEPSM